MNYEDFLETKKKSFIDSGFEIDYSELNPLLKDFQRFAIKVAIKKGRFAFFFDCGLGKTFCQLEWSRLVSQKTNKKVLILAPLAIVQQTIEEGKKFGINISVIGISDDENDITNYDQLKNIDTSMYGGVVLDESSILKGRDGKTSKMIIETFRRTPYKLCCTATPSPNDHMELGQHSEFLGGMTYQEMLAMYFVHDGGETSKWRLRKHAEDNFWKYVCTWSMAIDNPGTLGFESNGYDLPQIEYIEHFIEVENISTSLFGDVAVSATDLHKDLKRSFDDRINLTKNIVNSSNENFIIWGLSNAETDALEKIIDNSINLQGSDSLDRKRFVPSWFTTTKNECQCQKTNQKNIGQNITNKTKLKSIEKQTKDLKKDENLIQNIEIQELNTVENTILKTNQNSISGHQKKQMNVTENEEKNTQTIEIIEKNCKKNQSNTMNQTQKKDLKEILKKNTELMLSNTTECYPNKIQDAQFAEENHHLLKLNKDCTLTTATTQGKLEDCYASTAIKDWENLMIQKNCSKMQLCTCGKFKKKVLITKTSIMSFGINAQNCHNMIFTSYDFKFEQFYQAVRRCYRFGQKHKVKVHLLIPSSQENVRSTILQKQDNHFRMIKQMSKYSAETDYKQNKPQREYKKQIIKLPNF